MEKGIHTHELSIGYHGRKGSLFPLAEDLELRCRKGELVALVGPNGCGKSTLLRTIAGLHPPLKGESFIDGRSIDQLSPKEKAKRLSIVLTGLNAPANLSVRDLVSLGRSPYHHALLPMGRSDHEAVEEAIRQTNILHLADKTLDTLSDGEAQKSMIARALAQQTEALILDEPTAHLDLINRVEIARMLRELARERQEAIVMASHDLETILRIVDRVWLMNGRGEVRQGIPETLAMEGSFSEVFAGDKLVFDRETGTFRFLEKACGTLSLSGKGAETVWTRRALERIGFEVHEPQSGKADPDIRVESGRWYYGETAFRTLDSLIEGLSP